METLLIKVVGKLIYYYLISDDYCIFVCVFQSLCLTVNVATMTRNKLHAAKNGITQFPGVSDNSITHGTLGFWNFNNNICKLKVVLDIKSKPNFTLSKSKSYEFTPMVRCKNR